MAVVGVGCLCVGGWRPNDHRESAPPVRGGRIRYESEMPISSILYKVVHFRVRDAIVKCESSYRPSPGVLKSRIASQGSPLFQPLGFRARPNRRIKSGIWNTAAWPITEVGPPRFYGPPKGWESAPTRLRSEKREIRALRYACWAGRGGALDPVRNLSKTTFTVL